MGASRIYRINPKGDIAVWRENTNEANGLTLLVGWPSARRRRRRPAGRRHDAGWSRHSAGHARSTAIRSGGPNDLINDKKGGVYFTDPLMRAATEGTNIKPMGNVYYIRPDGRLLLIDKEIARPNGITLSLDEKTLYVNDGLGVDVFAFDVQPDGSARNKRSFVKLREPITDAQGTRSRADGMAVDSAGRLYVATGSGIQVIDPRGEYLGIIRDAINHEQHRVRRAGPSDLVPHRQGLAVPHSDDRQRAGRTRKMNSQRPTSNAQAEFGSWELGIGN